MDGMYHVFLYKERKSRNPARSELELGYMDLKFILSGSVIVCLSIAYIYQFTVYTTA